MLAGGVVIHHEQHVGIALGATSELRERRHVAVPHRTRRYGCKQLRHVVGRILQILFQRRPQLRLLFFEACGQASREALTSAGR